MRNTERGWAGEIREVSHRVFAFLSAGADTKANTLELIRAPSALPEQLQRRVALEALGESSSAFWSDVVLPETASEGAGKVHVKGS